MFSLTNLGEYKGRYLIRQVTQKLIEGIEAESKAIDLFIDYKYLNYAADFQDPIASYSLKN